MAAVIAAYQAATRDGDLRGLCRDVLSFGNPYVSSPNKRGRRCTDSPDLTLEVSGSQRGRGPYELLVRTIRIHAAKATATVAVREGDSQHVERFFLERRAGRWRITARGLTLAHEGPRIYSHLDCPPRTISNAAVDMSAQRASSANAFLQAYLGRNPHPGPASLILAGVDYRESTRTFLYQAREGNKLALFLVTGTNPYTIFHGFSFCRGSAGPYPSGPPPA